MSNGKIDAGNTGFSETYWHLHRNSLLFSLALIASSLPGVCLNNTQTWALVSGHFWQPLLQFALSCAAIYSIVTFYLEWRHEALSKFRIEVGLSKGLPEQIETLVAKIGAQISATKENREQVQNSLRQIEMLISNFSQIDPSDNVALQPVITDASKQIKSIIESGLPKVIDYQRSNPLPVSELLNHAEIGAPLYSAINDIIVRSYQSAKVTQTNVAAQLKVAFGQYIRTDAGEHFLVEELGKFEHRWADLRGTIARQNMLATTRTWAVGLLVPVLLVLTAFAHVLGSIGINVLPIPPLSVMLGQPTACPSPSDAPSGS